MPRFLILVIIFLLALAPAPTVASPATAESRPESPFDGFDEFIEEVRAAWDVPGLAIAVIRDGEVLFAKGYGYRDLENKLPVTETTLFAIGSNTKSFTTSVMGILNDEGKLDWDTPVREYLPDFRLFDPIASAEITPRDLVIHDSGLPRHDLLWYGSDLERRELFERLRYLEPNKPFRRAYQYQNLMFMTAGYLVGQITGSTWEKVVRQSIFEPLGMSRSNFSVEHSQKDSDFAYPYVEIDGEVTRVPFRNLDAIGPAGSINSSVAEMIRYVEFHINKGKHGERQLLSEKNARALQTPQMVITGPLLDYYGKFPEVELVSYGLGLSTMSYRGHKVVRHGGGIDGFISGMAWLPQEKIGLVVLTNYSGTSDAPRVVTYEVFDRLLNLEPIDWNQRFLLTSKEQEAMEVAAKEKEKAARKLGTSPSHALEEYAGTFEHPGYGTVTVAAEGSGLTFSFSSFSASLEHYHYDIFVVEDQPLNATAGLKVQFLYDEDGEIDRVAIPLESSVDDIVFTRSPKDMTEAGADPATN